MSVEQLLNVKFVKTVKAYPCIWENTSKGYRDKNLVKEAWAKVSDQVNEPPEVCRERWRNIRNAFLRSMKKSKNSSMHSFLSRKPYYLSSYLGFLMPFVKDPKTRDINSDTDENRCSEYESEEEDLKPGPFLDENTSIEIIENFKNHAELENTSTPQTQTIERPEDHNVTREHGNTEQYIEVDDETDSVFFNKRQKLSEETDETDSDMSFFKSLLRYVRKMNDKQNRKFRLRVLQALDETFDEEVEQKNREPEQLQPVENDVRSRKRKQNFN